jgi:hypothetical protein
MRYTKGGRTFGGIKDAKPATCSGAEIKQSATC